MPIIKVEIIAVVVALNPGIFQAAFNVKCVVKRTLIFVNVHIVIEITRHDYGSVILCGAGLNEFGKLFYLACSCGN